MLIEKTKKFYFQARCLTSILYCMLKPFQKYFFIPLLYFLTLLSVRGEPVSIIIGEIEKVYPLTQEVIVSVTNKKLFDNFSYVTQWQLLDEEGEKNGFFIAYKTERQKQKLLLYGHAFSTKEQFYAGSPIALRLPNEKNLQLPDSFQVQSFLKNVIVNPIDKSEMVLVASGPFIYGSQIVNSVHYTSEVRQDSNVNNNSFEKKILYQELSDFYIDRYEVTNKQFGEFLRQSGSVPPPGFVFNHEPDKPIANASYTQAERYCRWANKRLPTELEWEKAARGGVQKYLDMNEQSEFLPTDRIYPIGSEFNKDVCNTLESKREQTVDVHSLHDESPYRIFGMCGNALEWTSSWLLPYRGNTLPNNNYGKRYKVIRGGSFQHKREWAKTYSRMAGGIPTLQEDYRAGFRCAKDVD